MSVLDDKLWEVVDQLGFTDAAVRTKVFQELWTGFGDRMMVDMSHMLSQEQYAQLLSMLQRGCSPADVYLYVGDQVEDVDAILLASMAGFLADYWGDKKS